MVARVVTEFPNKSIKIMYQLSQSAQKDAWRAAGNAAKNDHVRAAARSRLQVRWLELSSADSDVWIEADELVWIDPGGTPIVFIGGREAYRWDEKQRVWTYADGLVPGLWKVNTENFGIHFSLHSAEQTQEEPLRVDRHDLSIEDLIDIAAEHHETVKASRAKAEKEAGELSSIRNSGF